MEEEGGSLFSKEERARSIEMDNRGTEEKLKDGKAGKVTSDEKAERGEGARSAGVRRKSLRHHFARHDARGDRCARVARVFFRAICPADRGRTGTTVTTENPARGRSPRTGPPD